MSDRMTHEPDARIGLVGKRSDPDYGLLVVEIKEPGDSKFTRIAKRDSGETQWTNLVPGYKVTGAEAGNVTGRITIEYDPNLAKPQ